MAAYRYTTNKDPFDGTASVVLERDDDGNVTKEIVRGGDPVDLTEEELAALKTRFNVSKATQSQLENAADTSGDPNASGPSPDAEPQPAGARLPDTDKNKS